MKRKLALATLAILTGTAQAQVYKCTDPATGRVTFSQTACGAGDRQDTQAQANDREAARTRAQTQCQGWDGKWHPYGSLECEWKSPPPAAVPPHLPPISTQQKEIYEPPKQVEPSNLEPRTMPESAPSANAKKGKAVDAVSAGYQLCSVFKSKGIATKCDISGWNSRIDVVIAMSPPEARKTCAGVTELVMAKYGGVFGGKWELHISSPYSVAPIATCTLY